MHGEKNSLGENSLFILNLCNHGLMSKSRFDALSNCFHSCVQFRLVISYLRENLKKSRLYVQAKQRAVEKAKALEHEDGATDAVKAFHRNFPRNRLLETYHDSDQ